MTGVKRHLQSVQDQFTKLVKKKMIFCAITSWYYWLVWKRLTKPICANIPDCHHVSKHPSFCLTVMLWSPPLKVHFVIHSIILHFPLQKKKKLIQVESFECIIFAWTIFHADIFAWWNNGRIRTNWMLAFRNSNVCNRIIQYVMHKPKCNSRID